MTTRREASAPPTETWIERETSRALAAFAHVSTPVACALVSLGLVISWLVGHLVGGAGVAAPHWFYLPVLYAAARFGILGAAVSALAAGILAGPLLPLDVSASVAQTPQDWLTRASFFLLIGVCMALVIGASRAAIGAEYERRHLVKELHSGIERQEFLCHYQPIVSLETGELLGAEALARWQHPLWGLVPPDRFIAEAEQSGLIVELGQQLLEIACAQLADWRRGPLAESRFFTLAVNLSARELDEPALPSRVEETIRRFALDPAWLHLEVTETALVSDVEGCAGRLNELKRLGVACAIDDFGTGQASLSYLHQFPVDVVKIDRSFVASLGHGGRADRVSRAVIQLAGDLGMRTVAEGVESTEQIALLRELGCSLAQGYAFLRPLPAEELEPLLALRAPYAALVGASKRMALAS